MKKLLVAVLLIICGFQLFAFSILVPTLDGQVSGDFYHPSVYKSELPYRTSLHVSGDLIALNFKAGVFNFGVGGSAGYTTKSLAYGKSIMKAYTAYGPMLGFNWNINNSFALGIKGRLLFCAFRPVGVDRFAVIECELVPRLKFHPAAKLNLDVIAPLTYVIRKDGHTLRAGVGVSIGWGK